MESEFKVGQVVRNTSNGTLFEVVSLPVPHTLNAAGGIMKSGDGRLVVKYRDNPSQIRMVDPTVYEAVEDESAGATHA